MLDRNSIAAKLQQIQACKLCIVLDQ
jgi:hypothetical protein